MDIREHAARYAGRAIPPVNFDVVTVDVPRARRLAVDYLAAPTVDAASLPSYRALQREIWQQLRYLTDVVGLTFDVSDVDPYVTSSGAPNSLAMRRDVAAGRIRVLSTAVTGSHPFLSDADNDAFRAVHDVFGHCHADSDFSPDGEERAWRAHSLLFSPAALPALTSETRAQNAANTLGGLPAGDYADQKLYSPPDWALLP